MSFRGTKTVDLLFQRLRVKTKKQGCYFEGLFKAFDRSMNLILDDCYQVRQRKVWPASPLAEDGKPEYVEERRFLGIMMLRGEFVQTLSVIAKLPPPSSSAKGGCFGTRTLEDDLRKR